MPRWEQYDTLNHPNWIGPNTTPTSAAFGKITGIKQSRPATRAKVLFLKTAQRIS
jgi:hypothetical protein